MNNTRTEGPPDESKETSLDSGAGDDFVAARGVLEKALTRSDLSTPTDFRISTSRTLGESETEDKIRGRMAPMGPEPTKAGPTDQ